MYKRQILEFSYDDQPPWPVAPDQSGYSLVLIAPHTHPDQALSENWRASLQSGGSPGGADGALFPADPLGDANGNGEPDLVDYALGNDLGLSPIFPGFRWNGDVPAGEDALLLTVPINLAAEGVEIELHFSTNLTEWQAGTSHLELVSTEALGDGRAMRSWRIKPPLRDQPHLYMRLRVLGR